MERGDAARRRRGDCLDRGVGQPVTAGAVEVRGLQHAYPDGHVAISGIDLSIKPGERVALLGPNGAGKTTLMLHLNGVLTPTSGAVEISGIPLSRENLHDIRRRVGLVFQDPDDQLFMPTVAQDVAFGPANFGLRSAELADRVQHALAAVSLTELAERSPAHLSGGQRRRAALATVLACEPEILVLDEPSANLDPVARRELAETLMTLTATLLIVTHDLPYAAQLCDRAVVMDAGAVVADGDILDVLADAELLARHRLELPWGFSVEHIRATLRRQHG
jgi:cobalt/nickel transport system ATP-binding protein